MMILPRQARDKHRENSKKDRFVAAPKGGGPNEVRENGIFGPFIYKMHYFTKTGSGQT
jgi:hypothetical protein